MLQKRDKYIYLIEHRTNINNGILFEACSRRKELMVKYFS